MNLTIMSQNVQHGCERDGRWRRLVERILMIDPHILFLQELRGWLDNDLAHVADAEQDLGMRLLVAPSQSGSHVGVAFKTDTFSWRGWETQDGHLLEHGYGAVRLELPGLPFPLVAVSAHLFADSAAAAAHEAQVLISRVYRHGGLGVIGGSVNHAPLGDPEPDWSRVQPHVRSSRAVVTSDGDLCADTIVGERFALGGLVDVAGRLADQGEPDLRAPTGKDSLIRVDQFHVTPALAPALTGYRRVVCGDASDHYGIAATLDLSRVDLALARL